MMNAHRYLFIHKSNLHRVVNFMLLPLLISLCSLTACAQEVNKIPPLPKQDEVARGNHEMIVLSGGCFWGVQGVFQHVKGVQSAISGYVGGNASTAQYQTVSTGTTGHAESVKIIFNPQLISLGELLRIYFSVAHDPTQLNRQGSDIGTQYRSAIWTTNPDQQRVASGYIAQLNQTGIYSSKIVTQINPLKEFYAAEKYHQNYLTLHPSNLYIVMNDLPKINNLKRLYPTEFQVKPILVGKY